MMEAVFVSPQWPKGKSSHCALTDDPKAVHAALLQTIRKATSDPEHGEGFVTDALSVLHKPHRYILQSRQAPCDRCRKHKVRCVPDGTGCQKCSNAEVECIRNRNQRRYILQRRKAACDRCRKHKVRCVPNGTGCQKCSNAEVECIRNRNQLVSSQAKQERIRRDQERCSPPSAPPSTPPSKPSSTHSPLHKDEQIERPVQPRLTLTPSHSLEHPHSSAIAIEPRANAFHAEQYPTANRSFSSDPKAAFNSIIPSDNQFSKRCKRKAAELDRSVLRQSDDFSRRELPRQDMTTSCSRPAPENRESQQIEPALSQPQDVQIVQFQFPPKVSPEAQKYFDDVTKFWRKANPAKLARMTGRLAPSDLFRIKTKVDEYGGYNKVVSLNLWDMMGLSTKCHPHRTYRAWCLDPEKAWNMPQTKDLSSSGLIAEVPEPILEDEHNITHGDLSQLDRRLLTSTAPSQDLYNTSSGHDGVHTPYERGQHPTPTSSPDLSIAFTVGNKVTSRFDGKLLASKVPGSLSQPFSLSSPISITSPSVEGLPKNQSCFHTSTSDASFGQDLSLLQHRLPTPISLERLPTNDTHTSVEAVEATPSNGFGAALSPQPRRNDDAGLHCTLATSISGDQPSELHVALLHQKSLLRKSRQLHQGITCEERKRRLIFERFRVLYQPSNQALLVFEELLHNIQLYFQNTCRNMILDDHGTLLTPNGAKLSNDLCNDFDSYCFTATMFKEKGLPLEFRRALSKAFALIEQILRAEHPRTLACFLEVFIHLIQTGLPKVASLLRNFIKDMSARVIRKEHPWGQICWLLGELDSESLDHTLAEVWKCTVDAFDSELGTSSRLAVSVRLDYIKRVYGTTNCFKEELLLRDLLAQFKGTPELPTPRVMLNLAHNLNRQGYHDKAEKMALEVRSLLCKHEIYTGRTVESIESLKIISHSQFSLENRAAEQTIREAIQMIVACWGAQHSWVPEFMTVLDGWLRVWNREEDANTVREDIGKLIGKDDIDEQPDGV